MTESTDFDRFSYLFDLASNDTDVAQVNLSSEERAELARIRGVLDTIDGSWKAPEAAHNRVRWLFLEKLAALDQNHPLLNMHTVRTVGDLVAVERPDIIDLPVESLKQLAGDPTTLAELFDPTLKRAAMTRVIAGAAVPPGAVGQVAVWLNSALADLVPRTSAPTQGFVYTRRQGGSGGRRQP